MADLIPFPSRKPTPAERGYFGTMYRIFIRVGADESTLARLRARLGLTQGSAEEAALLAEGLPPADRPGAQG